MMNDVIDNLWSSSWYSSIGTLRLLANEFDDEDEQECTHNRGDETANHGCASKSQKSEDPTTKHTTHNANNDVAQNAELSFHDFASQPANQGTNDKENENVNHVTRILWGEKYETVEVLLIVIVLLLALHLLALILQNLEEVGRYAALEVEDATRHGVLKLDLLGV